MKNYLATEPEYAVRQKHDTVDNPSIVSSTVTDAHVTKIESIATRQGESIQPLEIVKEHYKSNEHPIVLETNTNIKENENKLGKVDQKIEESSSLLVLTTESSSSSSSLKDSSKLTNTEKAKIVRDGQDSVTVKATHSQGSTKKISVEDQKENATANSEPNSVLSVEEVVTSQGKKPILEKKAISKKNASVTFGEHRSMSLQITENNPDTTIKNFGEFNIESDKANIIVEDSQVSSEQFVQAMDSDSQIREKIKNSGKNSTLSVEGHRTVDQTSFVPEEQADHFSTATELSDHAETKLFLSEPSLGSLETTAESLKTFSSQSEGDMEKIHVSRSVDTDKSLATVNEDNPMSTVSQMPSATPPKLGKAVISMSESNKQIASNLNIETNQKEKKIKTIKKKTAHFTSHEDTSVQETENVSVFADGQNKTLSKASVLTQSNTPHEISLVQLQVTLYQNF